MVRNNRTNNETNQSNPSSAKKKNQSTNAMVCDLDGVVACRKALKRKECKSLPWKHCNYLPISVEYECDDAKVWRWFYTRGLRGEGARVFGERTRHQMLNGAKRESFLPTPVPATRVVSLFSTIGRVAFNVPHTYMRNKTFLQPCAVFFFCLVQTLLHSCLVSDDHVQMVSCRGW